MAGRLKANTPNIPLRATTLSFSRVWGQSGPAGQTPPAHALTIREKTFGIDHPSVASVRRNLADLEKMGKE